MERLLIGGLSELLYTKCLQVNLRFIQMTEINYSCIFEIINYLIPNLYLLYESIY